jgi:ubiquitin C-terminal hydrolase
LLQNIFGGVIQHTIVCGENPTHRSEQSETFLRLSLDIKDTHSLPQALHTFFQKEQLTDYHCEKCNKKVSATKYCLLKRLPNVLIIHFKRFDFDVSLQQRKKLLQGISFPTTLDMHLYTAESSHDTSHQQSTLNSPQHEHTSSSIINYTSVSDVSNESYELVGVIVHRGTAEYGHYYSFIKNCPLFTTVTNNDKSTTTSSSSGNSGTWYRFDDTVIKPFDPSVRYSSSSLWSILTSLCLR